MLLSESGQRMYRTFVAFLVILFLGDALAVTRPSRTSTNTKLTLRSTLNVREVKVQPNKGLAPSGARSTNSRISTFNKSETRSTNSRPFIASNTSEIRSVAPRGSTYNSFGSSTRANVVARATSVENVVKNMENLSELNEFCSSQYIKCMDDFCNVLDENQGRCSCSDNLETYSDAEAVLKQANEELQEVAQQIRYIGLTAEEIETLFSETEAEQVMLTSNDRSQLKRDLDKIKVMIADVKNIDTVQKNSGGLDFNLSGLLDFSSSDEIFNLSSLVSVKSISNQRGKVLYDTAVARCKASVLNDCSANGADISMIMNVYDLEIAKHCIVYQRNLEESSKQLVSTVRNAENVLQRARLLVAQQKNSDDLRECINKLDMCMQDDFVCGDNYVQCLDPTGKYIVNGEVVVGAVFNDDFYTSDVSDISKYLQSKIGVLDEKGKSHGLCANVLSNCQNYVMKNKKYSSDNPLVSEYLGAILPRIAKMRTEIVSDYAASCIADVTTCISNNTSNNVVKTLSTASIRACSQVINTCRSLTDSNPSNELADIQNWLELVLGKTEESPETGSVVSQENDLKNCQAIGGSVSLTGTICIVKNVQSPDQLNEQAKKYGWAPYSYFTSNSVEVNTGSAITGKKVPADTYLYVMQYAYLTAAQKCESLGGTLNISVGKEHNNAYIYCTIDSQDRQITKEKCESLLNIWPQGYADEKPGGFTDYGDKQVCSYMPAGLYYLGRDLGGECLPDMVENQSTGNCTCKPGWCYENAYTCTEHCVD